VSVLRLREDALLTAILMGMSRRLLPRQDDATAGDDAAAVVVVVIIIGDILQSGREHGLVGVRVTHRGYYGEGGVTGTHECEAFGASVHVDREGARVGVVAAHADAAFGLIVVEPVALLLALVEDAKLIDAVEFDDAAKFHLAADRAVCLHHGGGGFWLLFAVTRGEEGVAAFQCFGAERRNIGKQSESESESESEQT